MTEKRFMVDDAGTLIDMQTRNTYDYVTDIVELLNELNNKNIRLSKDKQLAETEIIRIRQTLNDTIETERTNIGQSVLKQFKEAIQ